MKNNETQKQELIKLITKLLMKESAEKVLELLIFIETYLSK